MGVERLISRAPGQADQNVQANSRFTLLIVRFPMWSERKEPVGRALFGRAAHVALAVRRLSEHRIAALVVEDRSTQPVGIFSERDSINAIARNGAAVLDFDV